LQSASKKLFRQRKHFFANGNTFSPTETLFRQQKHFFANANCTTSGHVQYLMFKSTIYESFEEADIDDGDNIKITNLNINSEEIQKTNNYYLQKIIVCCIVLKKNWKCTLSIVVVISLTIVSIVIICLQYRPCAVLNYTRHIQAREFNYCKRNKNYPSLIPLNETNFHKIVLYGDSQISITNRLYYMKDVIAEKITKRLPHLNFTVISEARSGQHIIDLRNRMCKDVISARAEAVITFWDSDVTTSQDHQSEHAIKTYVNHLDQFISTMKSEVKYFAIAGPSLQGELPRGMNRFDQCLDVYEEINRNISMIYNISYIDVRKIFMEYDRENHWKKRYGYLTSDGEHPSYAGFLLLTELFVDQLEIWYETVET